LLYDLVSFYEQSLRNPCFADTKIYADWEICGLGCAINLIVQQMLDAFFRKKTFAISSTHKDYQRYFKHIFTDSLPMCDETSWNPKKLMPINPHYFYQMHVHDESSIRPLFQFLLQDVFWKNIKPDIVNTIPDDFPAEAFSAVHIRRGDKCKHESTCPPLTEYFDYVLPDCQIFLMTDSAEDVMRELEQYYPEKMNNIVSLSSTNANWNDGSFIDMVKEITVATRADSIACAGSSNICRLLWGLTSVKVHNVDTKSILCGDARNIGCLFTNENPVRDQLDLMDRPGKHVHHWTGWIKFAMKGNTGNERIIMRSEESVAKIRVESFWTLVEIPMRRAKNIDINFINGGGDNKVRFKHVASFQDLELDLIFSTRWAEWNCGLDKEDSRCKQVRDGELNWGGSYIFTGSLLQSVLRSAADDSGQKLNWKVGNVRMSRFEF